MKGPKISTHTLASTDEEETIGCNWTVKQIDHWARMTMADKRDGNLFLVHIDPKIKPSLRPEN